jgi:small basic protein
MVGLTWEAARDAGLAVLVGAVIAALVLGWVVRTVTSKLLALAVVAAVAVVVWAQRATLQDCADRVGATLAAGSVDETTCAFFGRDVTVTSPLG